MVADVWNTPSCPFGRIQYWSERLSPRHFSNSSCGSETSRISSASRMPERLMGMEPESTELDMMSPDNTSDGCLRKKWKIINRKRCLIKAGNGQGQQEPFNEVLASKIMGRIGTVRFVPYSLTHPGFPAPHGCRNGSWVWSVPATICSGGSCPAPCCTQAFIPPMAA